MPKNKTHSGTKKRFRVTGTGKLKHEQTNSYHGAEQKTSRRKRRLSADKIVDVADVSRIKRLLGR